MEKNFFNNVACGDLDIGDTTGSSIGIFEGAGQAVIPIGRPKLTNDFQGHGTHVAGSVLGNGTSETMGGRIRGTKPKAELVVQALLTPRGGLATLSKLCFGGALGAPLQGQRRASGHELVGSGLGIQSPAAAVRRGCPQH